MASSDLYGAVITFLVDQSDGSAGDLRTSVNNESSALLPARGVVAARSAVGQRIPRTSPALSNLVEVVRLPSGPGRAVGIGMKERDVVLDARFTSRQKDLPSGNAQFTTAYTVARALVNRYDGVSTLSIVVSGATFRRSSAEVIELDEIPDSSELIRSVVRLVFTFTEAEAAN